MGFDRGSQLYVYVLFPPDRQDVAFPSRSDAKKDTYTNRVKTHWLQSALFHTPLAPAWHANWFCAEDNSSSERDLRYLPNGKGFRDAPSFS